MKHTKEVHYDDLSLKKIGNFQTTISSDSIGFFVMFNKIQGHGQHNCVN
jgi:hypothetical protein